MSIPIPKQVELFEDVILSSQRGWTELVERPSLEDFQKRRVAVRSDMVEKVLKQLETKKFCVIWGPRDSGKTWLCYAIGFRLKELKKDFRLIELDQSFSAHEIWTYISKHPSWFFIVENCHIRKASVRDLVVNAFAQPQNRRFIFTGCDTEALRILKEDAYWIQLRRKDQETADHIKDIIKKFIEVEQVEKYVKVTDEEIEATVKNWSDDLRSVSLRLTSGWRFREGMRLTEIKDKDVYEYMLDVSGKMKLGLPERQNIYLRLSAICQFESALVSSDYLQSVDKTGTLRELEDEGLIEKRRFKDEDFFKIEGGKAKWILRAISYEKGEKGSEFASNRVVESVKDYIKAKPPNWLHILYCIRISREVSEFVREIPCKTALSPIEDLTVPREIPEAVKELLFSIFDDHETWKVITEMIEENRFFSLSLLPSLSRTLITARQAEKEQDIVQSLLQKGPDQMLHELSGCRIPVINTFLSFLEKRNSIRFKALAERIDIRDRKLARWHESAVQSKCKLCLLISGPNPSMSKLIVEDVKEQLKRGAASNVRCALGYFSKIRQIVNMEEFLGTFSTSDWENILRESPTLMPIFRLLDDFCKIWHLRRPSALLAQVLVKSDLKYLVYHKEADLYGLKGVIDAAHKLNVETKPLEDSILGADDKTLRFLYLNGKKREAKWAQTKEYEPPRGAFLAGLNGISINASKRAAKEPQINQKIASFVGKLAKLEASDLKDIFREVHSVNYFLPHPATKAPDACLSIMKKIGSEAWLDLIQSTLRDGKAKEDAFWLLWNIYRYNESLAKQLAERSANLFSQKVKNGELSEVPLPLIGLFDHLKVSFDGIFQKIGVERASEIMDSFKKRKPPGYATLILLSLIALSSRAPEHKFEALKETVLKDSDVKNCLNNNWDTQLQSVFSSLIRRYKL